MKEFRESSQRHVTEFMRNQDLRPGIETIHNGQKLARHVREVVYNFSDERSQIDTSTVFSIVNFADKLEQLITEGTLQNNFDGMRVGLPEDPKVADAVEKVLTTGEESFAVDPPEIAEAREYAPLRVDGFYLERITRKEDPESKIERTILHKSFLPPKAEKELEQ